METAFRWEVGKKRKAKRNKLPRRKITRIQHDASFLRSIVYTDGIYRNQHAAERGITLIKMYCSLRLHVIKSSFLEGYV